jgi:chaperonin GroES
VDAAEATSAGGILLPSAAQEKATAGVVASRGAGNKGAGLADGDRVVYSPYAGTEVKMGNEQYVILKVRERGGGEAGEKRGGGGMKGKEREKKTRPPSLPSPFPPPPTHQEEDVLGKQPGSDPADMTPLADRVLLRAVEAKRETDGGVILASDADVERPTLGEVSERKRGRERERESVSGGA